MSHSLHPVVPAPRCCCAPLLLMASLAASLLACPASAQTRGTYQTTYSGGSVVGKVLSSSGGAATCSNAPQLSPFNPGGYGPYTGSATVSADTDDGGGTNQCSASIPDPNSANSSTLTATLTWQPSSSNPNEPLPSCAIVTQTCDASWVLSGADSGSTGSGSTPSNGLGGVVFPNLNSPGQDCSGTQYSAWTAPSGTPAPASFPETCKPSVSFAGSSGSGASHAGVSGSINVSYSASATPITISLVGATSDGKGGWDILVGQKCAPFLYGIPSNCTVSNYQWTVSGTTMQSWIVSSDSTHTTEVDGSGPLNIESPGWFWNDPKQATATITCTAIVQPPTGQGAAFPVTVSQAVGVYLPSWSASGNGGAMLVDQKEPAENGTDYWLHASPISGSGQIGGMEWAATLSPPVSSPVTFDKGNIYLVQVITPSVGYINTANQQYENAADGQSGIDTQWPYAGGWAVYEDDPYQPNYLSNDSPGLNLTNLQAIYGSEMSSFEDYIMYQPPNSSEYVPLGYFEWSINGTATIPSTNNWADFKNPAGPIEPSGSSVPFTPSNSYPSWTQNSGNGIGFKPF